MELRIFACSSCISFLSFLMTTFLKTTALALFTIAFAGCSGSAEQPTPPLDTDDHHQGEANVMPHEHEDTNTNMPPSRSRLKQETNDDHHAGEENVDPHGH